MTRRRIPTPGKPMWLMIALAIAIGGIYLVSPVLQSGDGRIVLYEADSLIKERNLDISEFGAIADGFPCYRVGPRTISRYPWGTAIVAAPVVAVLEGAGALVGHDPSSTFKEHSAREFEKTVAAIIASFALLAMMQLVRMLTGRVAPALLAGVILGLATSMWSTVSRGLWQHGPLILILSLGLIALLHARASGRVRIYALAGLLIGAGFAIRPTALFAIIAIGVLTLFWTRRGCAAFAAGAGVALGVTVLVNLHQYDAVLNPFYFPPDSEGFIGGGLRPSVWRGLAGTSISPARGLLAFSPFLALGLAVPLILRRRPTALELAAYAVIFGVWLSASNTLDWPGGWSYGPRLLVDLMPFFAILLAPVLDLVTQPEWRTQRRTQVVLAVLVVGVAWGVFTNARGAFSWATQLWNMTPVSADYGKAPGRYFDWSDAPFFRTGEVKREAIYPWTEPADIPLGTACTDR